MLFPPVPPTYFSQKDVNILQVMEAKYAQSILINQDFWTEALTDSRFEAGDQSLYNEWYGNLAPSLRRQFCFNHTRPLVNSISGYERRTRKSIIAIPVQNADDKTADQFTEVIMWAVQQEGILETISEAFNGCLITGMNLLHVWVDYRQDPISGNIKVDNCSYNSFLMDPYFKKADLSDCNFIWKRSYFSKDECKSFLPDKKDDIESLWGNNYANSRDPRFQFLPESYGYGTSDLLTWDEYYYRTYRKQKLLIDTKTGEVQEWRGQFSERLDDFLVTYPDVIMTEHEVPTVNLAIIIQGKVMYDGPNPLGIDCYPLVPVFAYFRPTLPYFQWRITGIVRALRDPQFLYNRRKVIELDILESQVNSGWIYKEDALVNPNDIFLVGQGKGLALKRSAQMTDVQKIMPAGLAPDTLNVSEVLKSEMNAVSGVNEAIMGSAVDDKAGILEMLRQGAGMTVLQSLFDQLDYSRKLLGKIMIQIIQNNFTPGKISRIIEDQPTDQFYNKSFGRYDAAIEDGLNTTTQRQMQLAQMVYLTRETGIQFDQSDLIEASTLQNKNKILENAAKRQQQMAQSQEQQQQIAMMELQARAKSLEAKALADTGLFAERTSRVQENRALAVEKMHEARREDTTSTLNTIKSVKELEDIDLGHLERLLNMTEMINRSQDKKSDEGVVASV